VVEDQEEIGGFVLLQRFRNGGLWGPPDTFNGHRGICVNRPEALAEILVCVSRGRPLVVHQPCGIEIHFHRPEAVPRTTTPCLCGRPNCFLVGVASELKRGEAPWAPEGI
jgi:hypothetical protein